MYPLQMCNTVSTVLFSLQSHTPIVLITHISSTRSTPLNSFMLLSRQSIPCSTSSLYWKPPRIPGTIHLYRIIPIIPPYRSSTHFSNSASLNSVLITFTFRPITPPKCVVGHFLDYYVTDDVKMCHVNSRE